MLSELKTNSFPIGKEKRGAFHGNYGHCYYAIDNLNDVQSKGSLRCLAGGHNCIHLNSALLVPSPCDLLLTASSRPVWHRALSLMTDSELASRYQYYFFTPFAMCLNEQSSSSGLPPTDARFRQDVHHLEKGELEAASAEKHRLEEKQRAEARDRLDEYRPLWFKKDQHGEYTYTGAYEQRRFDPCPNLFSQASNR